VAEAAEVPEARRDSAQAEVVVAAVAHSYHRIHLAPLDSSSTRAVGATAAAVAACCSKA